MYQLERGIVEAGHQSVVIAAVGSAVSGELISTVAMTDEITEQGREISRKAHLQQIGQVLSQKPIDLIHFHGLDFSSYLPSSRIPKLATLHLPPAWYSPSVFKMPEVRFCCVSEAQADTVPTRERPTVVCNGIDLSVFKSTCERAPYLLWIGRICPEKGTGIALRVAHRLRLPLIVAGPVHPFRTHQQYFTEDVQPLLDNQRQWIGSVGLRDKVKLLSEARCLLIPSFAEETSSLVAMEACSSGLPVIAFRSGALPEVVEHEVTGFIVDDEDQMVLAVERTARISAERCRERAWTRFAASRMVRDYLSLYERILTFA